MTAEISPMTIDDDLALLDRRPAVSHRHFNFAATTATHVVSL
jgi:hypothetical protein